MNKEIFRKIENLLRNYNRLEAEIENIKEYYTDCVVIGYSEKSGPTNKVNSKVEDEEIRKEKDFLS